jgi:cell division protein FtsW
MSGSEATRRNGARPRVSDVDVWLVTATGVLLCLGMVMVASASMSLAERDFSSPLYLFWRQVTAVAVGLGGAWCMLKVPTRIWERLGLALLAAAFVLLISVFIPGLGRTVNGSTRWLSVAGVNVIQVSEPARLLMLLYVASYVVRRNRELRNSLGGFVKPLVFPALACVPLLLQPDFGSAVMLFAIALSVLFVGGARLRDFLLCAGGALMLGALVAVSAPYRIARLTTFLDPWQDPYDKGFHLTQSLIAIGSGEWTGLGLGGSVQKLFYLPEAHTDFLFAVIAEEFGLVGSAVMVVLFGVLTWRVLAIARDAAVAERLYQACVAFGIAVWQALQAFINMGVNMGILPTKGLTLPLVSYGRSSVIVTLIALGLVARIDFENRQGNGAARRFIPFAARAAA